MANFSAIFRLTAQTQGFNSTLASAKSAIGGLGSKLGDGLKDQVGKIFSVKGALDMLKGTMEEVLNRAKQYNNLGKRMGIPAVEVQKLDKAAEAAGINVASLARAMVLVQKFGGEAMSESSKKTKILVNTLGASKEQLKVLASGGKESLALLSDLMGKIGDDAERDYVGIKVLGEKWTELKPLIEEGGDAIRNAGKLQTTWSQTTQESLTRTQKAWAGLWNDLSVLTADLMQDLEPVVGALRIVGNVIIAILRIIINLVGFAIKAVQALFWGIVSIINGLSGGWEWVSNLGIGGADAKKDYRETSKRFEKVVDSAVEQEENLMENLGKDLNGAIAGAAQISGTDVEMAKKKKRSSQVKDTRTMEERQAYEEMLEKQKETLLATDLQNAKEEEKLDILKKQLDLLQEQEEELKKKHPEKYKETKEYLELQQKLAEQQRKIALQQRKDAKDLYDAQVSFSDLANERKIAKMKAAGATDEEIQAEVVAQQKEAAVRLSEELDALNKDKLASDDERRKKTLELAKQIGKAEDAIYEQQKKDKEAANEGGKASVSSLQAVGGGGAFAVTSMAARQLTEAQETNRLLEELVALSERNGLGSINAGTYGRPRL